MGNPTDTVYVQFFGGFIKVYNHFNYVNKPEFYLSTFGIPNSSGEVSVSPAS